MTSILWSALLRAVATDCGVDPYTIKYLISRVKNEGIRFLTVTLPKLAKSILRSVEVGYFIRPTDFAWQGRSLRYFRSLLDSIFCRKTGVLLPSPDVVSLNYIRQLTEYCYKLALSYTDEQLKQAEEKYLSTQKELAQLEYDTDWTEYVRKAAETYYPELFRAHPQDILMSGPKYGPGAFYGSEDIPKASGLTWSVWKTLPDGRVGTCNSKQAPYSGYFKPYPSSRTAINVVREDRIAAVRFVPKDSRGPRVISKEPLHQLRGQLAFFKWSTKTLERVSRNRINFVSQAVNQCLAASSSKNRKYATMDLKDASDRISHKLATRVFRNAPGIMWFLKNLRSTHYRLPSGRTGRMLSLAGMGSGLTFPVLAFITHLSVCCAIQKRTGKPFEAIRKHVYVYGDDLIVPTVWYDHAVYGLTKSGLLLNSEKSYWRGHFRESCGGDYYKGNECAPIRLKLSRCSLPAAKGCRDSLDVGSTDIVIALEAHCRLLRKGGMNCTAKYLEAILGKHIPLPYVGDGSPVLGKYTWDSSLIYAQGVSPDSSSPDGYLKRVAVRGTVMEDVRDLRCPYKFLGPILNRRDPLPLQLLEGSSSGAQLFEVLPIPRRLKLNYRNVPIISATAVAGCSTPQ